MKSSVFQKFKNVLSDARLVYILFYLSIPTFLFKFSPLRQICNFVDSFISSVSSILTSTSSTYSTYDIRYFPLELLRFGFSTTSTFDTRWILDLRILEGKALNIDVSSSKILPRRLWHEPHQPCKHLMRIRDQDDISYDDGFRDATIAAEISHSINNTRVNVT